MYGYEIYPLPGLDSGIQLIIRHACPGLQFFDKSKIKKIKSSVGTHPQEKNEMPTHFLEVLISSQHRGVYLQRWFYKSGLVKSGIVMTW